MYTTTNLFPPGPNYVYTQTFSNLSGANNALVPSLHYALPLGNNAGFGLSIVAPFGLSTDYGLSSPVRYAATLSKLETMNVSPELGAKLTDHIALGGGLDFQYAKVTFNSMLGSPAVLSDAIGLDPTLLDSESYNHGDSFQVGFHAGLLFLFNEEHTRLGVNYQSHMYHKFYGYSELTGRLADPTTNINELELSNPNARFYSGDLIADNNGDGVAMPSVTTLSIYQDITPKWAILASAVYFDWSAFENIIMNNVALSGARGEQVIQVLGNVVVSENYRDTWRFAIGPNYRVNDKLLLRAGFGYDETPTVNSERDVRLPDANRYALAIGGHYQPWKQVGFDLAYSYLFAQNDPVINKLLPLGTKSSYLINAKGNSHAQLVGLQAVWTIS